MQWFRETPWCFVPNNAMGWFVVVLTAATSVRALAILAMRTSSLHDLAITAVPYLLFIVGTFAIVARATSTSEDR